MTATSLTALRAKKTISLDTHTIGGEPVTFELLILSGESLIQARRLVLERDEATTDMDNLKGEELAKALQSGIKMFANLGKMVLQFPSGEKPTSDDVEHIITITGGLDGELAKTILKCIGLSSDATERERDSLDDLPT